MAVLVGVEVGVLVELGVAVITMGASVVGGMACARPKSRLDSVLQPNRLT